MLLQGSFFFFNFFFVYFDGKMNPFAVYHIRTIKCLRWNEMPNENQLRLKKKKKTFLLRLQKNTFLCFYRAPHIANFFFFHFTSSNFWYIFFSLQITNVNVFLLFFFFAFAVYSLRFSSKSVQFVHFITSTDDIAVGFMFVLFKTSKKKASTCQHFKQQQQKKPFHFRISSNEHSRHQCDFFFSFFARFAVGEKKNGNENIKSIIWQTFHHSQERGLS